MHTSSWCSSTVMDCLSPGIAYPTYIPISMRLPSPLTCPNGYKGRTDAYSSVRVSFGDICAAR